jgi:hypothetical protein
MNQSATSPARGRTFFWCGLVVGGITGALSADAFSIWPTWARVTVFAVLFGWWSAVLGPIVWDWFVRVARRQL